MKLSSEVKIGIIAVLAIAVTYWGLNYLKGRNVLKSFDEYTVFYNDITGLEVNSIIYISGYRIGQVNDIYFNKDKQGELVVKLGIKDGYNIPLNSVAALISADIMGTKAISIQLSDNKDFYEPGDTMISYIKPGLTDMLEEEILPIKDKAGELLTAIDTFIINLNYIFDEETAYDLKTSIKELGNASEEINSMLQEDGKLNKMISDIQSITANIRNHNDEIALALGNIASISDSIAQSELKSVINNTNETLKYSHSILKKIDSGEGTIGMLVNNDSLYRNLETTSADLDKLLNDLQENPKKYINVSVFGGRNKD